MSPNLHGNGYTYLTKAKPGKFIEITVHLQRAVLLSPMFKYFLKSLTVEICVLLTEPQRNSRSVFIIITTLSIVIVVIIIIIDSEHI
jgi:hypothetical protein